MPRLPILSATIRKLFANSGNQCAFPGCNEELIDGDDFVGQVCHIEAANEGGERYNPNQTDEERRNYENLLIFCYKHHIKTNDVHQFSVDRLKKIKSDHESNFGKTLNYVLPIEKEPKILEHIQIQFDRLYGIAKSTKSDTEEILSLLKEQLSNAVISLPVDNKDFLSDHFSDIIEMRKNGRVSAALALMIKFKDRNWSTIDDELKFKTILNLAGIYLELNQQKKAAVALLELEEISFGGQERAINLCLAYSLTENRVKFENITTEFDLCTTKNESYWTGYIILYKTVLPIEEIILTIPRELLESPQILINLSGIYFENEQNVQGFKYLELAKDKLPIDIKDKWLLQNWAYNRGLSAIATREKVHLRSFSIVEKEQLQRCYEAFTEIWEYLSTTDLRHYVPSVVYNRGMTHKYLGRDKLALKDFEEAWEINKNFTFFQGLVFHLHDLGEDERTATYYEQKDLISFEDSDEEREFDIMLSLYYSKQGNIAGAVNCLIKWLDRTRGEDKLKILNLIFINYFDNSAFEEAIEYVLQIINEFAEFPDGYYNLYLILKASKDREEAEKTLNKAYEIAIKSNCKKYNVMYLIGIELMDIERYTDAAACFGRIYTVGNLDEIGINLLKCYYRCGKYNEALEMYNSLDEIGKNDPKVNDHIFRIYENRGDLAKARELLTFNLEVQKGDAKDHFVKLSINFYKLTGESDELNHILKNIEITPYFGLEERFHIAGLLLENGFVNQGLELAYNTRLEFFQEKQAHEYFISLIAIQANRTALATSIFPETVQVESGVYLKNVNGVDSFFFLTDSPEISGANIVRSNEPLANRLIGKVLGDDITFPNSIGENSTQKVVSIIDRYTYAVRESMKILETKYPDQTSFKVIRTGDDHKSFKDYIHGELIKVNKGNLELFSLYRENFCPVGMLQQFLGLGYIETWLKLIGNSSTPFYCLHERTLENTPAVINNSENRIVLELSSLLTLGCILKSTDYLDKFKTREIYVSRSSFLELREYNRSMILNRPEATIGLQNGKLVKHLERPEDVNVLKKSIESIIEWCEKNAKILSPRVYEIETKEMCEIIGKASMDSLLLAKELNAYVLSDDERLKEFALGQFRINSFGTYTLIRNLCEKKVIDTQSYSDAKLKLIRYNYIYIPVDHKLLWLLLEESIFRVEAPFINAVTGLNCLNTSDLSTEFVKFAKMLYLNLALNESIEIILIWIISQLSRRSDLPVLKKKIKISIQNVFRLIPMQAKHISGIIDTML